MLSTGDYPITAPAAIIGIDLLGPFRVRGDGRDIPLTPTQELVLLGLAVARRSGFPWFDLCAALSVPMGCVGGSVGSAAAPCR
jgi:hypothetical protein